MRINPPQLPAAASLAAAAAAPAAPAPSVYATYYQVMMMLGSALAQDD
jgi:hypothetical protein